ncbi:hypothetical protein V7114_06595 [Neobacillus niacini]|uniref:hypothetical protein n=1 Tax=Neobacillus niacini TaxID=86668 RepID=UPI002FFDDD11
MGFLFFCNVDGDGKITESISGERIVPQKQYDYFYFIVGKEYEAFLNDLPKYKVIDGQLTLTHTPI